MPGPADIPGLPPMPAEGPQVAPSPLIQPCPQAFTVQGVTAPTGQQWVLLTFHGPCGSWSAFLDPPAAESLAAQLGEQVTLVRSGLVVAKGALPPPPVNGHRP